MTGQSCGVGELKLHENHELIELRSGNELLVRGEDMESERKAYWNEESGHTTRFLDFRSTPLSPLGKPVR